MFPLPEVIDNEVRARLNHRKPRSFLVAAEPQHFDVLIVGAGLSGIGAAWHLQKRLPGKSYAIFEGRSAIGGTWDLFRYPGVRSDSDMFTLGYRFKPWTKARALADGPSIRNYVAETAREHGIDKKIRFNTRVTDIAWSSRDARWTVTAVADGRTIKATCSFLWMCSGYYRYESGHEPAFPGVEKFKGLFLHPQKWPEGLDYAGKRVVVIGSGATAITIVPSMAEKAAHVTMLQRSPTYVMSLGRAQAIANFVSSHLPKKAAYRVMRAYSVPFQMWFYRHARKRPEKVKEFILGEARAKLPAGYDVGKHFTPRYNPWDERLCFMDDDDLFKVIASGKASVETDEIETFTERGIRLKSGKLLDADIVVSATGITLQLLGGAKASVDGAPVDVGKTLTYRGMMFSGVPNLVSVFGYLNASWTLRADLISDYVCRLLRHMDRNGFASVTPTPDAAALAHPEPFSDFTSGYMKRALDVLPKQADGPWRHPQNFYADFFGMKFGKIDDGALKFAKAPAAGAQAPQLAAAE
jgi:cation diffusion facilitator CzcD-associated flavoprotein CzcO